MSTSSQQIADLIRTNTELKQYFENNRNDIEARISAKEVAVDDFIQEAHSKYPVTPNLLVDTKNFNSWCNGEKNVE